MARRLIADTGVLGASERACGHLGELIGEDDDLVVAATTVAELRTGIELACESRRAARSEYLVRVLETLPVEPYVSATVEAHGRLLPTSSAAGRTAGPPA